MTISSEAQSDLNWWIMSFPGANNLITHGDTQVTMTTDASLTGWGACVDGCSSGGNWTPGEAKHDINYPEMLAVLFALKSFHDRLEGQHINLMVDNTTAVEP